MHNKTNCVQTKELLIFSVGVGVLNSLFNLKGGEREQNTCNLLRLCPLRTLNKNGVNRRTLWRKMLF